MRQYHSAMVLPICTACGKATIAEEVQPLSTITVKCLACGLRKTYRFDDVQWVPITIETAVLDSPPQ